MDKSPPLPPGRRVGPDPEHHPVERPAGRRDAPWEAVGVPAASHPGNPRGVPGDRSGRPVTVRGRSLRATAGVLVLIALLCWSAGCTSTLDRPPGPATGTTSAPATTSTVSITPVTPDGFISGPGVNDAAITLGLLVDPARDRGFSSGVELWQQTVNTSGGLCGRTVELARSGVDGVPADLAGAYDVIGTTVIGVITLPLPNQAVALNSRIVADQLPALTPSGTSAQLGPSRPVVIGPTEDILAINALDHLQQAGRLEAGGTAGVLTDGSAAADNALMGARWWAAQHDVTLQVSPVNPVTNLADWGAATAVLSFADATDTAELAATTTAQTTIVATIDGYDPGRWTAQALAAATAGRVLVSTAAPAFGSDYPAAVAVASRAAAVGQNNPGARLFDGYATGQNWGRLLTQACNDRTLTRTGVAQAILTVGPASVDSLYGPTDPARAVQSAQPATRVSAMSTADPGAPAGLRPLTWLESAAGIEDYLP